MKKKPYWVEVELGRVLLCGKNGFILESDIYHTIGARNQMARRLAKGLGIEFRQ